MSLADTFEINGSDYSPWAWLIYLVSALAAASLVAILAISGMKAVRSIPPAVVISGSAGT